MEVACVPQPRRCMSVMGDRFCDLEAVLDRVTNNSVSTNIGAREPIIVKTNRTEKTKENAGVLLLTLSRGATFYGATI